MKTLYIKHGSTRMSVYICFILIALMSYVFEADYMCQQLFCDLCINSSHSENIPQQLSRHMHYTLNTCLRIKVSDSHKT